MTLARAYLAALVACVPACASAPPARVHPFPLAAQVEAERAACLRSGGAFVFMWAFEDGPRAGYRAECVPNVGIRRVPKGDK